MAGPPSEHTTRLINTGANLLQLIAIVFLAGVLWQTVDHLEKGLLAHKEAPWHGSVGVEIATLKALMSQQIEEQRRLVKKMDVLVTKASRQ